MKGINNRFLSLLLALCAMSAPVALNAAEDIDYEVELTGNAGSGDFAPFYISSLTHGVITSGCNLLLDARIKHDLDTTRRFSYAYGFNAYAGINSTVDYEKFVLPSEGEGEWVKNPQHPSRLWIQELYGQVKYRGIYLTLGIKNTQSPILDNTLTSGDLISSGNSRPLPGARAGFIDFQDIPFTNGWVQIDGEVFYGKYTDSDWWTDHYNYYNGHITRGQYAVYRRCYFRTKPSQPFSITIGAQCASQFGGTTYYYTKGKMVSSEKHGTKLKDFIKMFWPVEDGTEGFIQGNTIGSWDFKARYRFNDGSSLNFYFQWPWEDGSGIGKLNGFDGLWGLEYNLSEKSKFVNSVAIEYLDLTNQSGPMHWDPDDSPGTDITDRAEGADDYYNNGFYNPYATYGCATGSPMVMSPLYNLDGYMQFIGNRMRGIHIAMKGSIGRQFDYRVKLGHRKAWGNGKVQLPEPISSTSVMLEGVYKSRRVNGLSIKAQVGLDSGSMPDNAFGALVSISYKGFLSLGKK